MKTKIQKLINFTIDRIHGSGIDLKPGTYNIDDWKQSQSKNFLSLHNSFHCMDENGFYEGWQDFTVKFPISGLVSDFKLVFNGNQYLAKKHFLKQYLEDILAQVIYDYLIESDEAITLKITCEYKGLLHSTNHRTFDPGEYLKQYFQDMKDFKGKIKSIELIY